MERANKLIIKLIGAQNSVNTALHPNLFDIFYDFEYFLIEMNVSII